MDHTLAARPGDETERLEAFERVLKSLCLSARLVAAANVEAEARRMKRGVRVFDVSALQQGSVRLVVHRRGDSERTLGAAELSDARREVLEEGERAWAKQAVERRIGIELRSEPTDLWADFVGQTR